MRSLFEKLKKHAKLNSFLVGILLGFVGGNSNVLDWVKYFGEDRELDRAVQLQELRSKKTAVLENMYNVSMELNDYMSGPAVPSLRVNERYKIKNAIFQNLAGDYREIEKQLAAFEERSPRVYAADLTPPGQNPSLRISGLTKRGAGELLPRVEFEIAAGECFFHKDTGFTVGVVGFPTHHTVQYFVAHTSGFSFYADYGNLGSGIHEVAGNTRFLVAPQKIDFGAKRVKMLLVYDTGPEAEADSLYGPELKWLSPSEVPQEDY